MSLSTYTPCAESVCGRHSTCGWRYSAPHCWDSTWRHHGCRHAARGHAPVHDDLRRALHAFREGGEGAGESRRVARGGQLESLNVNYQTYDARTAKDPDRSPFGDVTIISSSLQLIELCIVNRV